jgi:uncharacterized protein
VTTPKQATRAASAPLEVLAIMVICFGWFIVNSVLVAASGFPRAPTSTDASLLGIVFAELLFGAIALAVLRSRDYPLSTLVPAPTWRGCGYGFLLLITTSITCGIVFQLFPTMDYARQPIVEMMSGAEFSMLTVVLLSVINGIYEETFLLGYMYNATKHSGPIFAIGLTLLVRVLYHLYQGPMGAISVLVFGLILSVFYWRTGKLWPVVFAHILADVFALA